MYKYFSTQQSEEEAKLIIRRHWFTYLKTLILSALAILILLIAVLLVIFKPEIIPGIGFPIFIIVVSIVSLFIVLFAFVGWLINYLNTGIITSLHIVDIDQSDLFHHKTSILGLEEVQDVSAVITGVWQSSLDFGDVIVQTAGAHPNFEFLSVPYPNEIAEKISAIIREFKETHTHLHK